MAIFLLTFIVSTIYLLLLLVAAHFDMVRPIPRVVGTMADQKIGPCAGKNSPANRIAFSALNNSIDLTFYWDGSNDVYIGLGDNPTTFPIHIGELKNAKMGNDYTVRLDVSKIPAVTKPTNATIQVVCHQPKFDIYQCSDVVLEPLNSNSSEPSPPNSTRNIQDLAVSLTEHINVPFGCNRNKEHLSNNLSKNLAALWLRAVFHDVGRPSETLVAGLLPENLNDPENKGIGDSIATKFVSENLFQFSKADIIALAGYLAVRHCGGNTPGFQFEYGRKDARKGVLSEPLPDDRENYEKVLAKLRKLQLTDQEIVLLVVGSHTLGGVHGAISPHITKKEFVHLILLQECLTTKFSKNCF